jgi:hypothetical protein
VIAVFSDKAGATWRFVTLSILIWALSSCGKKAAPVGDGSAGDGDVSPSIEATPAIVAELSTVPGLADRSADAPLAKLFDKTDPAADAGWTSEAFSKAAAEQLHHLADLIEDPAQTASLAPDLVTADFAATTLRPALDEVYHDGGIRVGRSEGDLAALGESFTGADGLGGMLGSLTAVYAGAGGSGGEVHAKFKVIRVELGADVAQTVAYFEASAALADRTVQHTATLRCEWRRVAGKSLPLLTGVRLLDFEEVVYKGGDAKPAFVDLTGSLLGGLDSFREQLVHGADHWYGNLDVSFGIHQGNQGLSIGDADGDGLEDIFICQPAGLPSRLFLRKPDGSVRDATVEAGLDWLDNARSALFVDLDNDGDQDMAITLNYSLCLFENDGTGKFRLFSTVEIYSWPTTVAAADYDNDGDLDIYVCGYNPRGETAPGDIFANPVPYHDANNGARNFMLRNEGRLVFSDVTESAGLNVNNRRFSFAAAWEDYDNDGDQDLYVANDFGRNNLFRNDLLADGTRRFSDVAAEAGVEDIAAGMSASWGDYNRDGLVDLYVSNMFSSAGNRVAYQRQFKQGADEASISNLQRHARGNTLFENNGDGTFKDVSLDAAVTMGRWAWGSHFVDLNNDGWEDLYVANGFFTTPDSGDL